MNDPLSVSGSREGLHITPLLSAGARIPGMVVDEDLHAVRLKLVHDVAPTLGPSGLSAVELELVAIVNCERTSLPVTAGLSGRSRPATAGVHRGDLSLELRLPAAR